MSRFKKIVLAACFCFVAVTAAAKAEATTRVQTYQVHCLGSPLGEVTANLYGYITTADGSVYPVNLWCHTGVNGDVSVDPRPSIPSTAGKVLRIDLINRVYLRLPSGQRLAVHPASSSNGFFSATSFYDSANKEGEAIFTIDIGN